MVGKIGDCLEWPEWIEDPKQSPPVKRVNNDNLWITYINHATVLIQNENLNILTDPIWSYRAGPVSWIGVKRVRAPGISMQDLPPVDIILISHDHYDHLDLPTLRQLNRQHTPVILAGLGMKKFLGSKGFSNVIEMDWWQKYKYRHSTLSITFVPAHHDSGRNPFILASANGHLEIVKYLISKGADIDARGNNGITALMVAIGSSHYVHLNYEISRIKLDSANEGNTYMRNDRVYVTLQKGADGIHKMTSIRRTIPRGSLFISGRVPNGSCLNKQVELIIRDEQDGRLKYSGEHYESFARGDTVNFCLNDKKEARNVMKTEYFLAVYCGTSSKPAKGTVEEVKVTESIELYIEYGIESYFVEEGMASHIERSARNEILVEASLRSDGKALITGLFLNGARVE